MKAITTLLLAFIGFSHFSQAQNLDAYSWLAGTWKQKDNHFERWVFNADKTSLEGTGFMISQGDTTIIERIAIRYEKGNYFYVAAVASNEKPVLFRIVESTPQYFRAENSAHDFPKYILYTRIGENKIEAEVGAGQKKYSFSFEKTH